MSETKPPGPDADKLARQLQESLARRRPTAWKPVLAVLSVCTLFLALFAFWLKPRPPAPLMPLVALDGLYTPDETPLARIQLFVAAEDAESAPSLRSQDVLFQGQGVEFVHQGGTASLVRMKTDSKGQTTAELPKSAGPALMDFQARHIDDSRGLKGAAPDSGQVFVWPKDAPLLIVDVDETLMAKELDAKAVATLKTAAEARWRIVYLSVAGAEAESFRQARDWLREQADLPAGPVLGRSQYPSQESAEQARIALLRSLNVRFTGPKNVVVKSAQAAETCAELRLRAIVIGDAKTSADVIRVTSWAEVFERLK